MNLIVSTDYLDLIRLGLKTASIRTWRTCRLRPGDPLTFNNYRTSSRGVCTSVTRKRVGDLDVRDAQRDGFDTVWELRCALRKHYPTLTASTRVWVIGFDLLPPNDSAHSARAAAASG